MSRTPYQRHNATYWEKVIADFQQSTLTAPKFCDAHGIAYASFCKWRHQFSTKEKVTENSPSTFIDLQSLATTTHPSWNIVLKLGNGVELVLSQSSS
ncbi:MAG: hypothetical protein RL368_151 [Pseudomonadota bacterium]